MRTLIASVLLVTAFAGCVDDPFSPVPSDGQSALTAWGKVAPVVAQWREETALTLIVGVEGNRLLEIPDEWTHQEFDAPPGDGAPGDGKSWYWLFGVMDTQTGDRRAYIAGHTLQVLDLAPSAASGAPGPAPTLDSTDAMQAVGEADAAAHDAFRDPAGARIEYDAQRQTWRVDAIVNQTEMWTAIVDDATGEVDTVRFDPAAHTSVTRAVYLRPSSEHEVPMELRKPGTLRFHLEVDETLISALAENLEVTVSGPGVEPVSRTWDPRAGPLAWEQDVVPGGWLLVLGTGEFEQRTAWVSYCMGETGSSSNPACA